MQACHHEGNVSMVIVWEVPEIGGEDSWSSFW